MNKEQLKDLRNGLYEIFWKSGGSSLCAIGTLDNGDRWLSPTNWSHKYPQGVTVVLDKNILDDILKIQSIEKPESPVVTDIKIKTIKLEGDPSCNGCMFYDIQQNSESMGGCSLVLETLGLENCSERNLIFKKG